MTAQGGDLDAADVDAVDQDLALLDLVVAADQGQNGGLAGAGGAYEGHGLLGLHMEGNALEHPFVGLVAEPYVLKLDLAPDLVQLDSVGSVHHLGNDVHNGEDLFRGGKGALQRVKLLGKGLNGVKELGGVHIEGDDDAAGDGLAQKGGVLNMPLAAQIQQAQHRGDVEQIHQRTEGAVGEHPGELGLLQPFAPLDEVAHLPILLIEDLGDLHAGKVLGKVGVDLRGGGADPAVGLTGELVEQHREEYQEGCKAQDHQSQGVVEHQHGHQHAHDHQRVFGKGHQNVGEHIGNGVGIVGHPGDQLADGDIVELFVGELLNMGEQVKPQGGQDLLTGFLQDHGLHIGADQGDHQNARIDPHHGKQGGHLEPVLNHALDAADEQRRHHVIGDGDEHGKKGNGELPAVVLRVDQQPADQLAVGHMALIGLSFHPIFGLQINQQKDGGGGADDGAHDQKGQILMHCACLLPLPAFAGLPFCGRPDRFHKAPYGCRRQ